MNLSNYQNKKVKGRKIWLKRMRKRVKRKEKKKRIDKIDQMVQKNKGDGITNTINVIKEVNVKQDGIKDNDVNIYYYYDYLEISHFFTGAGIAPPLFFDLISNLLFSSCKLSNLFKLYK